MTNNKYEPKTAHGKFMSQMKKKHDTKKVDEPTLKKVTMESLLKDNVQVPSKLHMVGTPESSTVKPAKKGENKLHTGKGKDMFKGTIE